MTTASHATNDRRAPRTRRADLAEQALDVAGRDITPGVAIGETVAIAADGRWQGTAVDVAGERGADGPPGAQGRGVTSDRPVPSGIQDRAACVVPRGVPLNLCVAMPIPMATASSTTLR